MKRCGFSLIDLLVVVAVSGIMTALVLPALQTQRERTRRLTCANHLKQYGLGIHNYHDVFKVMPQGGNAKKGGHRPLISWQVRVLPFTEQVPLYERINMRLTDCVAQIIPKRKRQFTVEYDQTALAESHQVPYSRCPSDDSESYSRGWSSLGTADAGLRIQKGGKSGLAAQTSYCGNLGAQLTSAKPGSRATPCDQYNDKTKDKIIGSFDEDHGSLPFGFKGAVNTVKTANKSEDLDRNDISGMFGENLFPGLSFFHVKDGTSNTFFVGEVLANCVGDQTRLGWWHYQDFGSTRASVSVPLNTFTTCVKTAKEAKERKYLHPDCAPIAHGMDAAIQLTAANTTWGYRSWHPEGANFLMGDGSVQFIKADIDYRIYIALGGRDDGRRVRD